MARTLNQTVFAGGVIYAAGTPEAEVKADVPDQFWAGSTATETKPTAKKSSSKAKDD